MELIYKDVKYTEEMLLATLESRDSLKKLASHQENELATIRGAVFDFFNEGFTPGDTELTFSVDSINELLESIGCLKLKTLFTVRATIDVTVTGIEAESEDEAESYFHDYIGVDWGLLSGEINEFTVDVRRVEAE